MNQAKKMKGISRIDSRSTHGWFVRIYRDGQTHSKMYSDQLWGGKQTALQAARKYRNEYERKHPQTYAATRIRMRPQCNNTSGVVGVSDTHDKSKTGEKQPCFSVSWRPRKNVVRCKKFYYHDFNSREEAFATAVKFRKERESEIIKGL